jgi:hypothetical protein
MKRERVLRWGHCDALFEAPTSGSTELIGRIAESPIRNFRISELRVQNFAYAERAVWLKR